MKKSTIKLCLTFLVSVGVGVLLHFLYEWLPSPITALISPVRESLWEHLKIIFFPFLAASLFLTREGEKGSRTPWLLSLLLICAGMLGFGYLYHVIFRGESMVFDILLYLILMAVGFLLPRVLWPLGEWPGLESILFLLVSIAAALIFYFTFRPPEAILFADLSQGVRTFFTIPV